MCEDIFSDSVCESVYVCVFATQVAWTLTDIYRHRSLSALLVCTVCLITWRTLIGVDSFEVESLRPGFESLSTFFFTAPFESPPSLLSLVVI